MILGSSEMNQAAETTLVYHVPGSMVAVLQEEDENGTHESTLQYVLLLLSKVALNTLILSFWFKGIPKTLPGIFSISIYLTDLLLVGCITWAWLFHQNQGTHEFICTSLSHGSTVYSMLPLPFLLAGVIECVAQQHMSIDQTSVGMTAVRCMVVLLMWMLAFFYSSSYTKPELLLVQYKEGVKALVCPVQGSMFITYFTLNIFSILFFTLLLHYRNLPHWIQLLAKLSKQRTGSPHVNKVDFSNNLETLESGDVEKTHMIDLQDRPPLLISLVLCFALNWAPYLFVCVVCNFMDFAIPAYASVNLLYITCTNSLLVGVAVWHQSNRNVPFFTVPDDVCQWSLHLALCRENRRFADSTKQTFLMDESEKSIVPCQ